ncbi:M48 family metallopeptidase [Aquabacterium humicola]|uniref:M48 family metallopeptidase n=1 Tax=Aquabacterium humicola TaxID=3237377 RepID=UPI002543D499|nr:M48 family metallopeptidase [Rubrivivax pictus]
MNAPAPPALAADYFDGHSARAHPVRLTVQGRLLHIDGDGIARQVPLRRVSWPERQRHGARQAYLPDHGLISSADAAGWDAWAARSGLREGLAARWMQSWRGVLVALVLFVGVMVGGWRWGLPAAAHGLVALTPASVDAQLGALAFEQFEGRFLQASKLSPERQAALRARFEGAVKTAVKTAHAAAPTRGTATPLPAWTLHFRATPDKGGLGPNAFALPGGHIVVTDALVDLLADRPDVLIGVLGHELGHVQHRHGMRSLVQVGLLTAVSSLVLGDFSSLLTAAPVLLGQAAYSRGFEFEADADAARLMRANGLDPGGFAVLFERLRGLQQRDQRGAVELPIGLATHPPDAERVRRMQAATAER